MVFVAVAVAVHGVFQILAQNVVGDFVHQRPSDASLA